MALLSCQQMIGSVINSLDMDTRKIGLDSIEVNFSEIPLGDIITVNLSGKPIYIFRRSPSDIANAEKDDEEHMKDHQTDSERVKRKDLLVVVAICTHLGCVPITRAGEYNAFFCPCHGSHFDAAGRIRIGPAATNLIIPSYKILDDSRIRIG